MEENRTKEKIIVEYDRRGTTAAVKGGKTKREKRSVYIKPVARKSQTKKKGSPQQSTT